jgi:hypothetical protein
MDAPRYFELSYTRPAVPIPWNASIDQYCEVATSAVSSIGAFLNSATGPKSALSSIGATLHLATGAASPVSSIGAFLNSATGPKSALSSIGATLHLATGAASPVSSIGTLLKLATGAAYFAYPDVVTASAFLTATIAERANSTDVDQAVAETDSINETLDRYENLKDGWLNERSKAPGFVAVTRARKLYESAKRNGYPPVRCYVSPDGEAGLIWQKGRGYGNVGFWPDGSLVYYVRPTDGTELRDDIVMDGENLPGELIKALRTF